MTYLIDQGRSAMAGLQWLFRRNSLKAACPVRQSSVQQDSTFIRVLAVVFTDLTTDTFCMGLVLGVVSVYVGLCCMTCINLIGIVIVLLPAIILLEAYTINSKFFYPIVDFVECAG